MDDYEAQRHLACTFDGVPYSALDGRDRLIAMKLVYDGVMYLDEADEVFRLV